MIYGDNVDDCAAREHQGHQGNKPCIWREADFLRGLSVSRELSNKPVWILAGGPGSEGFVGSIKKRDQTRQLP